MPDPRSELARAGRYFQRPEHADRKTKAPPMSFWVREFTTGDGRKMTVDKRGVAFVVEARQDGSGAAAVIGFRAGGAKPTPVREAYSDVIAWWLEAAP